METGIVENMDKSLHAGELANYNKATKETTVSKQ
jgi:hypothetical protein